MHHLIFNIFLHQYVLYILLFKSHITINVICIIRDYKLKYYLNTETNSGNLFCQNVKKNGTNSMKDILQQIDHQIVCDNM